MMSEKITPYKDSQLSKKEQVATMFNTISGNYDNCYISRALLLLGTYKSKHQLNIFFSPHGRSANLSVAQVKNTSQARKVCVCVCDREEKHLDAC